MKRGSAAAASYASTLIFSSIAAAHAGLDSPPDLVVLGSPAAFRGTTDESSGNDAEVQLSRMFPTAAIFVEKPVGAGPVEEPRAVGQHLESVGSLVSVGYMLRYSAAVQKMKQIIQDNNLAIMMTSARYVMGKLLK